MVRAFRLPIVVAAIVSLGALAAAQAPQRLLTVDAIYHPERRVDFSGSPSSDITWLDAERMESAFASLDGVTRDDASRVARSGDLVFNDARSGALVTIADDLFAYDFTSGRAARLTRNPAVEEEAMFSPDGRFVAFVRANNLYVVDVTTGEERALTTDGSREILNGKLDWLYQEEIYGRGRFRAFWWSPDSTRLAFLQLDERPVPEYTVVDHIPYRPTLELTDYPKAGDPNPTVKLGLASAAGGDLAWADLSRYAGTDILVVNVDWTPDSQEVVHQVTDREQTWLDLNLADASRGTSRRVLRETTKAWVNENGNPAWLGDGSFLWFSERSGFKHLYRYKTDGSLVGQVTSGRWDVRTLYGVDEKGGVLYFSSAERSPLDTDVYRIGINGSGLTRISRVPGTHRATFNPDYTRYVDAWSDVDTPTQVRLHGADGSEIRVIDANPVPSLDEYRLSGPEFLKVKARDGFVMDGMLIKPPDFDPSRRYPVYQFTYAGPGAAQVRNQWGGTQYMFHQLLAQHGVVVWVLDNRSASGQGVESQWQVYGRLGEQELEDLEDGVAWLKQQPYVDPSRILLSGWSYGGFMAAYALTHSTSWSAGIVGAPVTDWRDYDSIYTERYMKTPQNNPDGYRTASPRFAAKDLHGRLLLIHGTTDDNVHVQNTMQFAYELQQLGIPFEMMLYPKTRHTVFDKKTQFHLQGVMLDFIRRQLLGTAK